MLFEDAIQRVRRCHEDNPVYQYDLHSESDQRGVRSVIARVIAVPVDHKVSEELGIYTNDSIDGEILFRQYNDGHQEIWAGAAIDDDGNMCSYIPLHESSGDFTKYQVDLMCNIMQSVVSDYMQDPDFKLNESVASGIVFADDELQSLVDTMQKDPENIFEGSLTDEEKEFYDDLRMEMTEQMG